MFRVLLLLSGPLFALGSVTNTSLCNATVVRDALAWMKSQQATSGLLESFDAPPSATWAQNRGYSYDQAVAAIAHMLHADNSSSPELTFAESILTAMKDELSFESNGQVLVPFYWDTVTLSASSLVRTGNAAWVAQAFGMHALLTGETTYLSHLEGIAKYLLNRLRQRLCSFLWSFYSEETVNLIMHIFCVLGRKTGETYKRWKILLNDYYGILIVVSIIVT